MKNNLKKIFISYAIEFSRTPLTQPSAGPQSRDCLSKVFALLKP